MKSLLKFLNRVKVPSKIRPTVKRDETKNLSLKQTSSLFGENLVQREYYEDMVGKFLF